MSQIGAADGVESSKEGCNYLRRVTKVVFQSLKGCVIHCSLASISSDERFGISGYKFLQMSHLFRVCHVGAVDGCVEQSYPI